MEGFLKCPKCEWLDQRRTKCACGYSVEPVEVEAPPKSGCRGSLSRSLLGAAIAAPLSGIIWAATGWFSGAVLWLFVKWVAKIAKGHEYIGDFWGHVLVVAWWGALIFGALGLLVGCILGARMGRRGEPFFPGILRRSWNAFGIMATFVGAGAAPVAAAAAAHEASSNNQNT